MTSTESSPDKARYPAGALAFPHRDLIGIGQLERHEVLFLLDEAEQWVALNRQPTKHEGLLSGLTVINAFFENSTRTLLSFEHVAELVEHVDCFTEICVLQRYGASPTNSTSREGPSDGTES